MKPARFPPNGARVIDKGVPPCSSAGVGRPAKLAVVVSSVLALYALLGVFAVPHAVRWVVASQVEALGCEAKFRALSIQPFSLELRADGVRITCSESEPILSLEGLQVDLAWRGLWNGRWVVERLGLRGPQVRISRRADGSLELLDAINARPTETGDGPEASGSTPRFELLELELSEGRVRVVDASRQPPFDTTISDLAFRIEGLTNVPRAPSGIHRFSGESDRREQIRWSGALGLDPLVATGSVSLSGIDLPHYDPYLHDVGPFDVDAGRASGRFGYRASWSGAELEMALSAGDLTLSDVRASRGGTPWVALRAIHLVGFAVGFRITPDSMDASVQLARLELRGGRIAAYTEMTRSRPDSVQVDAKTPELELHSALPEVSIHDLDLTAAYRAEKKAGTPWPTASTSTLAVRGEVELGSGGKLSFEGEVAPLAPNADVRVALEGLNLEPFAPIVGRAQVKSGIVSAKGRVRYDDAVSFAGGVLLEALDADADGVPLLGWRSLRLEGFSAGPSAVRVDRVAADGLDARVVIEPDGGLNLQRVFAQADEAEAEEPSAQGDGITVSVGRVDLNDATLRLSDRTVRPAFSATLGSLRGSVLGLGDGARGTLDLRGQVDRHASASLSGEVHVFDLEQPSRVDIALRNLSMIGFTPYSGKYGGWTIEKGKLDVDLSYRLEGSRVRGENAIRIEQLTLGDRVDSAERVKLPVKLGVALLKDRQGRIDLDIPITGSLEDPQFKIGKLVWRAVLNTMEKALLSPFASVGGLFEPRGERAFVSFVVGTSTTGAEQSAALRSFEAEIAQRPDLVVELRGEWDPVADRRAIAEAQLAALLDAFAARADSSDLSAISDPEDRILVDAYRRAFSGPLVGTSTVIGVFARAASRPWSPALEEPPWHGSSPEQLRRTWIDAIVVPQPLMDQVARARAETVQDALLGPGRIAPQRVFIVRGRAGGAGVSLGLDVR